MKRESIEERFSIEIDDYLNGVEGNHNSISSEYDELIKLSKNLADKDFSGKGNKDHVLNKVLENKDKYEEENIMKKPNRIGRKAVAAAVICIMSISIMSTSFAQDFVGRVINKLSLGHVNVIVEPQTESPESVPVPEELKGKIFDEDGNEVKIFSREYKGKYYTADGEEIESFGNNEIVTKSEQDDSALVITEADELEVDELNKYTCFDVILPTYLPEGYRFDKAEFFKDENGVVENSKYISLYFTNEETGGYMYMQQRFADEETAYTRGSYGETELIKINGVDAILDASTVEWEANNVIYMLLGRGEVEKSELIKIAESIK
ncbi:DUF4367 domain-containing protein [Clostridiisalibacter paucivorans]|uniref:DUF4367 domain-containing protein n=1 Tax=Clostridiisalibacter paucivorans TaxID=408753 RepID=UPI00047DBEF5|nr:DUF4367 domain-containing protein [Clostridiisalibacter paucivorans]